MVVRRGARLGRHLVLPSWSSTLKEMFDGLVYGVLTGLVFMWMWPA